MSNEKLIKLIVKEILTNNMTVEETVKFILEIKNEIR